MSKRILVVDDSPVILDLLHDLLSDEGYTVITQHYPVEGADQIRVAAPNLIILDYWQLFDGSRWTALELIRHNPELEQIPTIICIGITDAHLMIQTPLQQKNVVLISKPFNVDDLLDMVRLMIN